MYEDWYTSARLGLLDHQTDWYYTPAKDEDRVSVIILNTGACQRREIIPCHWLWERFADCHENLSGKCRALWQSAADGGGSACTVKILAEDWITTSCFGLHLFHYYHVCPHRHCKSLFFSSYRVAICCHSKKRYSWYHHHSDTNVQANDLFICTTLAPYITMEVSLGCFLLLGPRK